MPMTWFLSSLYNVYVRLCYLDVLSDRPISRTLALIVRFSVLIYLPPAVNCSNLRWINSTELFQVVMRWFDPQSVMDMQTCLLVISSEKTPSNLSTCFLIRCYTTFQCSFLAWKRRILLLSSKYRKYLYTQLLVDFLVQKHFEAYGKFLGKSCHSTITTVLIPHFPWLWWYFSTRTTIWLFAPSMSASRNSFIPCLVCAEWTFIHIWRHERINCLDLIWISSLAYKLANRILKSQSPNQLAMD